MEQQLPVGEVLSAQGTGRFGLKRLAWGVALIGMAGILSFSMGPSPVPAAPRFVAYFGEGACSAEGTWEDGQGAVDFKVTESEASLTVAGLPQLLVAVGANGAERLKFNNVSVDLAGDDALPEKTRLGFTSVAQAMAGRTRGLSKFLASQGWNGADRPCAYKMHMLLLLLAKEETRGKGTAGWTGPYGHEKDCPAKRDASWRCRVESGLIFIDEGAWYKPGSQELAKGHSSFTDDVKCESTDDDLECHGLCGKTCDCWESVCGSDYLCEYNPVCCAHDYACDAGLVTSLCVSTAFVKSACDNNGLKTYGPESKW